MSNLELYDGTVNPEEHLRMYKCQMYVQDVDDALIVGTSQPP